MTVIDNFLHPAHLEHIRSLVGDSPEFTWTFLDNAVDNPDNIQNTKVSEDIQIVTAPVFRHTFAMMGEPKSPFIQELNELFRRMAINFGPSLQIRTVFANLLPTSPVREDWVNHFSLPHVDINYDTEVFDHYNCYTGLFYLNDCEGDTLFFGEMDDGVGKPVRTNVTPDKRVSPKANRFLYWDSRIFHSGPSYVPSTRMVINLNFATDKGVVPVL